MPQPVAIDAESLGAEAADVGFLHGVDSGMRHHVGNFWPLVGAQLAVHHLVYPPSLRVHAPTDVVHAPAARPSVRGYSARTRA